MQIPVTILCSRCRISFSPKHAKQWNHCPYCGTFLRRPRPPKNQHTLFDHGKPKQ